MRNHTATHLLQAAMREVLGSHVHQKGSLVSPERLRFDFTHGQPISPVEISRIEQIVNTQALKDTDVVTYQDLPIAEAKSRGAMALFGEKYGDRVRMVEVGDFSRELCGGIHLKHTSQIGLLKVVGQTGVSAGVRRIEAVTGDAALDHINRLEETISKAAETLKTNPVDLVAAAERAKTKTTELEAQIRKLKSGASQTATQELKPQDVNGVAVVTARLDGADSESIANLVDKTATQLGSAVIVLASEADGKVAFAARVTPDLLPRGLHAGNLVREVAKITGGGGGGRADFAQAGGRDPGKLQEALDAVPGLVTAQLK